MALFREDHRTVRDGLLGAPKDVGLASEVLGELNELVGPHFRFEEEALYPALRTFLGGYVDELLTEHDGVIATAKACVQLLEKDTLTDQEAEEAARALLVHVSNCDGLAILCERLDPKEFDYLAQAFSASRAAGVPLLQWADTIRRR
ncbi:MAG: hemerythrin domain-containing protein [Thermodesulfobacteriota bacterium]